MIYRLAFAMLCAAALFSCAPDLPEDVAVAYNTLPKSLDFNKHIKPILSDKCFSCHGPDKASQKAGLRLDVAAAAYAELPETPGKRAIVPGSLRKSEVFERIITTDPEYIMPEPSSHLTLNAYEKAVLIKWIEDGAEYKPHWAFIKPEEADVPEVKAEDRVVNPIDNFVISKLEQEGLSLSPEADKAILLRRVSLDLTGLPPTIEETEAFLKDKSPKAYEKQVDRLMASAHYGERIAADWLDVARYADSHGYSVDRIRDMSPWRDWVIKAFNQNLPYNDFVTWQLAGDLLPNPTREQLIATAFNRNHQQNMEGGIVDEEFRIEYVADRINTTSQAFMALTAECARCHDHKFDPISQKEYFQMFSFFNNVKEAGQISWDNAMPVPTLLLTTKEEDKIIAYLNNQTNQKENELKQLRQREIFNAETWIKDGSYKKELQKALPANVVAHYSLKGNLKNSVRKGEPGTMRRGLGRPIIEKPVFADTEKGKSVLLNGDTWIDFGKTATYNKSQPFSIGIWVNIPKGLKDGVIFHRCSSSQLYNYRGFSLSVADNLLELKMAHTAPYNAIIEFSKQPVPKDKWIQLTLTYDGSGKASGYKIFLNGGELATTVDQDNLYKDIVLSNNLGLQIGAWDRGKGLTGGKVNDVVVFDRALTGIEVSQLFDAGTFDEIVRKEPAMLTAHDREALKEYYLANASDTIQKLKQALKSIRMARADTVEPIPELMIMQEMEKPRSAYILDRGVYDSPTEKVSPDVPKAIFPMPANFPRNRLGLAKWLTHADHPLTARVAVNRYWQMLFGKGLVKTAEDFGNQGEMPSHPELLDWLSIQFVKGGWNVKALLKMMVMSSTYRQSSVIDKKLLEKDPENILLARASPSRLTAEMIRDNALFASDLLNDKIGGKSAYPYQPEGLWRMTGANYQQDTGSNVYRRGLYTVWRRSSPNPTQATFDVGIRTSCIVRRQKTNTPLQALITLNDPTFVEAAKVLGEKMTRMNNDRAGIIYAFRSLTGRKPTDKELALLVQLQQLQYQKFKAHPEKIKGWLNAGMYKADSTLSKEKLAANAVVASSIINTDASITKR